MRIGIDLDNTIINYKNSLKYFAEKNYNLKIDNNLKKEDTKKIITKKFGNKKWTKLQEKIYSQLDNRAELFNGLNFFFYCCFKKNVEIFIVSHKTIYPKYNKNIELRKIAQKWLEKNLKFEYFQKNKLALGENLFFCNNIEDKIKKINELKLDYFIDDLFKIISHRKIDKKIKRILFNSELSKNNNIISCQSWIEISNLIFKLKIINYHKDIITKKFPECSELKKIKKGTNNHLYEFRYKNKYQIIKFFIDNDNNNFKREKNAYSVLKKSNFVPYYYCNDDLHNFIVIEKIEGKQIFKISNKNKFYNLEKIFNFFLNLDIRINDIDKTAKEPFLGYEDLLKNISKRKKLILHKKLPKKIYTKLKLIDNFFEEFKAHIKKLNKSNFEKLLINKKIYSPSDMGLQNLILKEKNFYLYDFEYFGVDSAIKFISDFYWHPSYNCNLNLRNFFLDILLNKIKIPVIEKNRTYLTIYLFGIKWAYIILNIYNPIYISNLKNKLQLNKKSIQIIKKRQNINFNIHFDMLMNFKKTYLNEY